MSKQAIGQISTAENLAQLAKKFKSGDPVMSSALRKEFKNLSLNDNTRIVVYLMEVIGSRDQQFTTLQKENVDLRELLKLNNIALDGEENESKAAVGDTGAVNAQVSEDGTLASSGTGVSSGSGGDTTAGSEANSNVNP